MASLYNVLYSHFLTCHFRLHIPRLFSSLVLPSRDCLTSLNKELADVVGRGKVRKVSKLLILLYEEYTVLLSETVKVNDIVKEYRES